ncbi:hypothetical protein AB0F91_43625, partial [Amycolatopsis sp. NPDC023774]|uniref:hypothetical protein n=1 Tax=Amycolatopsis sp. NPDC023774 TaxID=3155015 RepID=UPI0033E8FACC
VRSRTRGASSGRPELGLLGCGEDGRCRPLLDQQRPRAPPCDARLSGSRPVSRPYPPTAVANTQSVACSCHLSTPGRCKRSFPALGGIARQLEQPHILANQLGHNIPADEE